MKTNTLIIWLSILLCFLSSSLRLGNLLYISSVIPIFFLILFFITESRSELLILGILCINDFESGYYEATPNIIRYAYILIVLIIFRAQEKIRINKYILLWVVFLVLKTLYSNFLSIPFNSLTFRNNVFVLITILIISSSYKTSRIIDFRFLTFCITAYLVGEYMGILLFEWDLATDNLSYNSTKFLVLLPSLYFISKKDFTKAIVLIFLTLPIVIFYNTRMLMLIWMFVIFALIIKVFLKHSLIKKIQNLVFILTLFIVLIIIVKNIELDGFKVTSFIYEGFNNISFIDFLIAIDPDRFYEHLIFFDRPILDILFGSGLGTGIYDEKGYLSFIGIEETAFSKEEIISQKFFNFHDFTTDLGLRFGLFPVIAFLIFQLKQLFFANNLNLEIMSIFTILILTIGFFTPLGLIILIILHKSKQVCVEY